MFSAMHPPAHLMHWQKMKACRFRDVRRSLVGKYVVTGHSATLCPVTFTVDAGPHMGLVKDQRVRFSIF